MLTKESQSLIDSFIGKTDIKSFLKDSSLLDNFCSSSAFLIVALNNSILILSCSL